MNEEELDDLIHYSELCSRMAEVNVTVSSIGLLSTIVINGKAPTFGIVMCGVCGVMLSYNAYNMYNLEKKQKQLIKKKSSHT